MDERQPRASSIGIWNGYVVGLDDELLGLTARHHIDAGGATMTPGFHDAHCHTTSFGLACGLLDLTSTRTVDGILEAVAKEASERSRDDWVIGMGYGRGLAPGEHPPADELDRVAGGRPVWLTHVSGHMCVINHAALALIELKGGAQRETDRGRIHLDANGRPTGLLEEAAMELVKSHHGPSSVAQLARAIDHATRRYATEGITSFTDAGVGCPGIDHSPVEIAAYQRARQSGRLRARAQLMIHSEVLHNLPGHRDDAIELGLDLGIRSGIGDSWLEVGAVKVWVDGSGTAGTAATSSDGGAGIFDNDPALLSQVITSACRSGWQVACHAMGDRALDLVLRAVEKAREGVPDALLPEPRRRHRIEHGGLIRTDQIELLSRLEMVVVPQPVFIAEFGDTLSDTLCGGSRTDESFRVRSLLDAGVPVAGSSDRPVAPGSPLLGIQSMVERLTASGNIYGPNERVSAEVALASYTQAGAYACHNDHRRGKLCRRLEADLVVLGDDPTRVEASKIGTIEVLATLVGGVATHDPTGMFGDEESALPPTAGRSR
ncbi:MAG: amidohydrolase [Acidimicrobiales bacterium]